MAGIRAGSVQNGPFRRAREGCALVLSPGICHVRHRTALLSQLVTRIARGHSSLLSPRFGGKQDLPRFGGKQEGERGGQPPVRQGRVERRRKSSHRPLSGTKVAS